jgi:hypothetical protein
MTFCRDLFIALHIIYDRMAPEEPIREPTIVSMGLANMKPSAHNAHPE